SRSSRAKVGAGMQGSAVLIDRASEEGLELAFEGPRFEHGFAVRRHEERVLLQARDPDAARDHRVARRGALPEAHAAVADFESALRQLGDADEPSPGALARTAELLPMERRAAIELLPFDANANRKAAKLERFVQTRQSAEIDGCTLISSQREERAERDRLVR